MIGTTTSVLFCLSASKNIFLLTVRYISQPVKFCLHWKSCLLKLVFNWLKAVGYDFGCTDLFVPVFSWCWLFLLYLHLLIWLLTLHWLPRKKHRSTLFHTAAVYRSNFQWWSVYFSSDLWSEVLKQIVWNWGKTVKEYAEQRAECWLMYFNLIFFDVDRAEKVRNSYC